MSATAEEHRRRLAERFATQSEARRAQKEERMQLKAEEAAPEESATAFLTRFAEHVRELESRIATIGSHASPGSEVVLIKTTIKTMEREIGEAALFLPTYDVKQCQSVRVAGHASRCRAPDDASIQTLSSLLERLHAAQEEHVPRKRFTFGSRHRVTTRGAEEAAGGGKEGRASVEELSSSEVKRVDETVLEMRTGEELTVRPGDLEREGKARDARLTRLTDCTVAILDLLSAMHVDGLTRCTVYVGAIAGSIMVHNCEDCVFVVAARQIRIHTSRRCRFRLLVLSNPIIEHCQELTFGPFCLSYIQLRAQQEAAGLLGGANMWDKVNDFNWHRRQQSPHWRTLSAEEQESLRSKHALVEMRHKAATAPAGEEVPPDAARGTAAVAETGAGGEDSSDDEL